MAKKAGKIAIFLGILFAFFLKANFVLALEIKYPTLNIFGQSFSINNASKLQDYVCYLYGLGSDLAFIIAVLAIAFGGVYYLVSYGRGKFTSEAKDWIKAGVLGLLIVVCASLILYTINPAMQTCKLGVLSLINFNPSGNNPVVPPGVTVHTYKEIPIGTLTENLLTRKMNCFGFDQNGNPIDGNEKTKDIIDPTYDNHDRADCLAQLVDGAQKKAQVIAALSDEIMRLMNTCSCRVKDAQGNDTGQSKCDPDYQCNPPTSCPGGTCIGPAVGGPCHQPYGTKDCCEPGVKDQIEHGPINMAVALGSSNTTGNYNCIDSSVCLNGKTSDPVTKKCACITPVAEYSGLDEFRCPSPKNDAPCSNIASWVAIKSKKANANNILADGIDPDKWNQLTLLQQLTYLKERITRWQAESKIQEDVIVLDQARAALNSCYLAVPHIDLFKIYQTTDKTKDIILTAPETFQDPGTGQPVSAAKYCSGFNYANSSCLKKCNDKCPDASQAAMSLYKNCGSCQGSLAYLAPGSGGPGQMGGLSTTGTPPPPEVKAYMACIDKQTACIKNAYNSRPCTNSDNASQTFSDCLSSCQNDCSGLCAEKYAECSDEYAFCQSQCQDNGQCALDNADKCLFNSQQFVDCANQVTDQGNSDYCIGKAYLCKNGSNEFAGYPDCGQPASVNCSSFTDAKSCVSSIDCGWDGQKCFQNFSASFFFQNPTLQKCPYFVNNAPAPGSICYNPLAARAPCIFTCPEATKCTAASKCGLCPCDKIDQPLNFSVPNKSDTGDTIPCTDNSQCSSGELCWGGICANTGITAKTCSKNSDCSSGETCSNGACVNKNAVKTCTSTSDCSSATSPNFVCLNGVCVAGTGARICTSDSDCPLYEVCPNGRCISAGVAAITCKVDPDCASLNKVCANGICVAKDNTGKEGYITRAQQVSAYQIVGPQCNEYSYNDDPLTFYCEDNWGLPASISAKGLTPTPIGKDKLCQRKGEVPVGQTVDNAKGWAEWIMDEAKKQANQIQPILDQMTKIGKAITTNPVQDYCKCNAKLENNNPICKTDCQYWEVYTPTGPLCGCQLVPCKGSPCQQEIDYLAQLWNDVKQFKTNFITFYTTMLSEPRSDIMKELTYSRNITNDCSVKNNAFGSDLRLLDCTRAKDEILTPVNAGEAIFEGTTFYNADKSKIIYSGQVAKVGCYGRDLGVAVGEDLTDNWFCCEDFQKNSAQNDNSNNNSIYKVQK